MRKRTRRILFYVSLIIFLAVSYLAVLYAKGYRYSFVDNKFYETGSIYIKANTDASIYLNDQLLGTTSFFNNAFVIGKLLPGQYELALAKKDTYPWYKTVNVEEGLVVEFSKVLLLEFTESSRADIVGELKLLFIPSPTPTPSPTPRIRTSPTATPTPAITDAQIFLEKGKLFLNLDQEPRLIDEKVRGFRISPDGNKATWWTQNDLWMVWLNNTNYQPYKNRGDIEFITRVRENFQDVRWFRGEDHLAVLIPGSNISSPSYQIIETDTRGGTNVITF